MEVRARKKEWGKQAQYQGETSETVSLYAWSVKNEACVSLEDPREGSCKARLKVFVNVKWPVDWVESKRKNYRETWKEGIDDVWSYKYKICCTKCPRCPKGFPIFVDISYANDPFGYDVIPIDDVSGGDTGNWPLNGKTAAHEVGHMIGNDDEYGWYSDAKGSGSSWTPVPGGPVNLGAGANIMGAANTNPDVPAISEKKHYQYMFDAALKPIIETPEAIDSTWTGSWGEDCYLETVDNPCKTR